MSGAGGLNLVWRSPGPVSDAFMASWAPVNIINGPIGSAKTTTALMKLIRAASRQRPSTTDRARDAKGAAVPVRKFTMCVVRQDYRSLWRTTMQSWFRRVPREAGTFTGAENAPARHAINFALPDGTMVQFVADFIAIGDNSVEDVLRGYEPTAFYLNEIDTLAKEVLTYAAGRTGRFPPVEEGGSTWHGIVADCNAPVIDSWLYNDMFLASPDELAARGVALFRQPGGRAPGAENLRNLPPDYYARQVALNEPWYVRRMVDNLPGFNRAGQPIYPSFNDLVHVAPGPIAFVPQLPLIIGLDGGQTVNPAAAFCQRSSTGKWRVLAELTAEHGTGPTRFGEMLARFLRDRFAGASRISAWADPSAFHGADQANGEAHWAAIVGRKAGIRIAPAPSNAPVLRWDAVRRPLAGMQDGTPDFQLDPRCRVLRAGFNAGYRFNKVVGSSNLLHATAAKTHESHVHDALQYACLGGGEYAEIRRRVGEDQARSSSRLPPVPIASPYAA